jgi:predicted transcriptional regulator
MKNEQVLDILKTLDEEFNTKTFIEKLLFIDALNKGLQDIAEGRTMTLEEAKRRFKIN